MQRRLTRDENAPIFDVIPGFSSEFLPNPIFQLGQSIQEWTKNVFSSN